MNRLNLSVELVFASLRRLPFSINRLNWDAKCVFDVAVLCFHLVIVCVILTVIFISFWVFILCRMVLYSSNEFI
jgi:hypothetical protein